MCDNDRGDDAGGCDGDDDIIAFTAADIDNDSDDDDDGGCDGCGCDNVAFTAADVDNDRDDDDAGCWDCDVVAFSVADE